MSERVLAIDPGKATGFAINQSIGPPRAFQAWWMPENEAMDWVAGNLHVVNTVVIERITINVQTVKKSQDVLASIRQIGVVKHLARWKQVSYIEQSPSEALGFAPDDLLKAIGWYTPGVDHPRDATRHLVHYLAATDNEFRARLVR